MFKQFLVSVLMQDKNKQQYIKASDFVTAGGI
jgi:hypothetical protein